MSELRWFVVVLDSRPRRIIWDRSVSFQDAFFKAERKLKNYGSVWSVYALEDDGSYWDGEQFVKLEPPKVGWCGEHTGGWCGERNCPVHG